MSETEERMLLPEEAARLFGVTIRTLARWADEGKVSAIKTPGGQRRYPESKIKALLETQEG